MIIAALLLHSLLLLLHCLLQVMLLDLMADVTQLVLLLLLSLQLVLHGLVVVGLHLCSLIGNSSSSV